jgi:hypothetical protein
MIKRSWVFGALLSVLVGALCAQEKPAPANDPFQLALVLKAAREYSRRLEAAALDFICLEEVTEKVDLSRENVRSNVSQLPTNRVVTGTGSGGPAELRFDTTVAVKRNSICLYDYQFVRRVGKIKEKRTLLEKDGKKVHPDAPVPANKAFNYSDILLAPVQLLDDRFSEFYSYRLLGKETVGDTEAWVLEVTPRLSGVARYLGAKLWLKADDASVLRIEWDPSTFGNYEAILARAKAYKAEPELRSVTEFGVEKNGLRFPSADLTEEAYRGGDGKLYVRARTNIVYKDHKFFTVETEATFKK